MKSKIDWTTGGIVFQQETQEHQDYQKNKTFNLDINRQFDPRHSKLSVQQRFKLIKSLSMEVLTQKALIARLQAKQMLRAYDGFEPSGRMHIAQGILRAVNVNKLVDAGCIFIFWIADWFAMLNNKYDGNLQKIKLVGKYFIEVWRAAGMKMHNVKFLWASDEINNRPNEYWLSVMDIARRNNITRIKKCATALGKKQGDELQIAQLFYPCMQCSDIFFLDLDICQLGNDQRKVNTLAIEYANKTGKQKPIIVSHSMMNGLLQGQDKMSKSNPDSAIFMEDSQKEVRRKIQKAFCKQKQLKDNPIINYCQLLIFEAKGYLQVLRKEQHGGNKLYKSFEELASDFEKGHLHPNDLKPAVANVLNEMIEPVRVHFESNPQAKSLLQKIKSF